MDRKILIGLAIGALLIGIKIYSSSPSTEISEVNSDDQLTLITDPNPPKAGKDILTMTVVDSAGKTVDGAVVTFDINMTTMNMGAQSGTATPQGNGKYSLSAMLSMRGPWKIAATATMPDGKVVNKDFTINAQ